MIKLFSDIYITKGYNRSVLQDFARGEYHFIPNLLAEIIEKYDGKVEYSEFQNILQSEHPDIFDEYCTFLNENEFIFDIDKEFIDNFPTINATYEFPYDIINISIFFSENNIKALKTVFENNVFLNVPNLHFFISNFISFKDIEYLINFIYSKSVKSIRVELWKGHKDFERFNNLTENKFIQIVSNDKEINIDFFETEEYKQKYPFILNHYIQYYEAKTYNTYLNKRIFIDNDGNIKLTPKDKFIFGNIDKIKTEDELNLLIVKNNYYKDISSINRSLIDVCKDCELRMMCIDDKIPVKNEDYWFLEKSCSYNPYISKWKTENDYVPIEECGSYSKETGFVPDKEKIAKLNAEIWNE